MQRGKNDTIHTNIQINGPKFVLTYEHVWAIATVIFCYTGSPQVKIPQKVLGGYFFDSHCTLWTTRMCRLYLGVTMYNLNRLLSQPASWAELGRQLSVCLGVNQVGTNQWPSFFFSSILYSYVGIAGDEISRPMCRPTCSACWHNLLDHQCPNGRKRGKCSASCPSTSMHWDANTECSEETKFTKLVWIKVVYTVSQIKPDP